MRTKHLRARMHLGKEAVDEKHIEIVFVLTAKMIADGFSKPLEGQDFVTFVDITMGKETD